MHFSKATTAIGIGFGLVCLGLGATLEGTSVFAFFNIPAALIVLGGTLGATMAGTSLERIRAVPRLYLRAIRAETPDLQAQLEMLTSLAERARREGLLALDDDVVSLSDPFARKGLQLVVDGTDPEVVREILNNDVDGLSARRAAEADVFEKAAGFAPTMGILGTVMGLVAVLKNLASPASLGAAISTAFIATLYGVGVANVVFLPVSNKLKLLARTEIEMAVMTLEGILAIQAGDNPRVVGDRLASFLPPVEPEPKPFDENAFDDDALPPELEEVA